VLKGENVERAIRTTGYPLLSVLQLGCSPSTHSGKLSPIAMRNMFDRVADNYDLVLIDCGPVLGSVEAAIVSAEADGVVLVVSRGGDRTAAEDAVNLLNTAGAVVEGIVFNRARHEDVAGSVYSSSSSIRSMRSTPDDKSSSRGFGGVESAAAMHGTQRSPKTGDGADSHSANDKP
jgi:Mrp family chromosome partitioning ATPase